MSSRVRILKYRDREIRISSKSGKYSRVEVLCSGGFTIPPRASDGRLKTLAEKLRIAKQMIDKYWEELK
jgi:hypothetical protein